MRLRSRKRKLYNEKMGDVYKEKNEAGFTLIEMIVSMVIIAFVSGAMFMGQGAIRKYSLERVAREIASNIRDAQNRAISGKKYNDAVPCGYGIHYLNKSSYLLYAGQEASGDCGLDRNYNAGTDSIVQTFTIPPREEIEISAGFLDIFFEPPHPIIYINKNPGVGVSTTITLKSKKDPTKTKDIVVTTAGKIEIR